MSTTQQTQVHLQDVAKARKDTRMIASATATVDSRDDDKTLLLNTAGNVVALTFGAASECAGLTLRAVVVGAGNNVTLARSGSDVVNVTHTTNGAQSFTEVTNAAYVLTAPPKGSKLEVVCTGTEWFVNVFTQPSPAPGPGGVLTTSTISKANNGGIYAISLDTAKTLTLPAASTSAGTVFEATVTQQAANLVVSFPAAELMVMTITDSGVDATNITATSPAGTTQTFTTPAVGTKFRFSCSGALWFIEAKLF